MNPQGRDKAAANEKANVQLLQSQLYELRFLKKDRTTFRKKGALFYPVPRDQLLAEKATSENV